MQICKIQSRLLCILKKKLGATAVTSGSNVPEGSEYFARLSTSYICR